jgi:LPS-assembly lipoprotein
MSLTKCFLKTFQLLVKNLKVFTQLALVILFCSTLNACGFHPRGEIPLAPPLHNLYLKSVSPYDQLARNLRQALKQSGVHFASSQNNATVTLEILSETTGQQLLSVSGTQQTRQYNLILTVVYQLLDAKGRVLVAPQSVSETRTIPIQTNQILAGSNEANNLYRQMRFSIVYVILNRLASNDISYILTKKP